MIFREVEDRDLIAKARRGNVDAYNVLVSRWEKRVFNYLLRLVGHREDALDLSQDVFLKVQLRKYGGNGYAHVLRSFLPRLKRLGLSETAAEAMLTEHPRRVFEYAANTRQ